MANTYTQCYFHLEEYLGMLEKNDVVFNQEYLFEFLSDISE
jgi:hypothetical protein